MSGMNDGQTDADAQPAASYIAHVRGHSIVVYQWYYHVIELRLEMGVPH